MTMIHFTKSLLFKVTLLVITVELVIFAGVGVFYTHRFSQEIDNAIIARLSIPGLLMTRGELSFDAVSDKRTMEGLLREPYSEGIVIGLDGRVYFSSNPARLDTHLDEIDGLRLPGPESSTFSVDAPDLITPVQDSTGIYLTCLSPLRPDGKLTGYLYLKVGTGISEAEKRKIAILFAIGSLGTIALTAAILSWLLHLMVIRRLNYLVEIFRRFALGDYAARAEPLGGDDEIAALMNGFNGLSKRLEDTMAHLIESESRFRVLVEHAPEAILVYDVDTNLYVEANQNAERLLACSLERLRLSSPTDFFAPVQPDPITLEQSVGRALAGEEVVVERAITDARGRQLLCEVRLVLLPAGNSRLIRASYLDITERKRAEEELRRLTLFQRTILDNAAYGIISAAPDGVVTSFNPAAERLLGYTADEVVGKHTPASWHDPEEIARRALQLSEELGETILPGFDVFAARPRRNLPEENEWTFIRKDGTHVPVLLSVTELRDESGRIKGFVGLTHDLTERKQMVESLREGEAFLNSLLNAIPIPVFYKDRDGRYLGFNRAYETFFGATRDQLIGKTVFDIAPRELAENYRAKDIELFESGEVQQYESQVKNTHGVLRNIIFNKAVFTDSQGTIIGLIGAILDITKRKRAEEELKRLNEELEQRVEQRTAELAAKNEELAKLNRVFVGRELRMIELKEKIKELEERLA